MGSSETETSKSFFINNSGQILWEVDNHDDFINIDDKYIIISYYIGDQINYKFYGDSSGELSDFNFGGQLNYENAYHSKSKNGFYFICQKTDSDDIYYYSSDDSSTTNILSLPKGLYISIIQHRFTDISYIFTSNPSDSECLLKVYRGAEYIDQFVLSDNSINSFNSLSILNENGDIFIYGQDTNNLPYTLFYNGSFIIEQHTSNYWYFNTQYSYYYDLVADYYYNAFTIFKATDISYQGPFISGTDKKVYTFFSGGTYSSYEYNFDYISTYYIVNDDAVSYLGYDTNSSVLFRKTYTSDQQETFAALVVASLSLNDVRLVNLPDKFIIFYLDGVDSYSCLIVTNDDVIYPGITFSTNISTRIEGNFFFMYDYTNMVSYLLQGNTLVTMNNYSDSDHYDTNFLTSDYKNNYIMILDKEDEFPKGYTILSSSGSSDRIYPFFDFMDFAKGDVYTSRDKVISVQNASVFGAYYFSDQGTGASISDGGNDMFDDANRIYTNIAEGPIIYTHTPLVTDPDGGVGNDPSLYTMDGVVMPGDGFFGPSSSYFTNLYPGLFTLVADNVSNISTFYLDGNLGSDGDGLNDSISFYVDSTGEETTYGSSPSTPEYIIFVRRVYDAYDPSICQIFIFNNIDIIDNYTHVYDTSNQNDYNSVTFNGNIPSRISYLLVSKPYGLRVSDEEVKSIVKNYILYSNGLDIYGVLSSLSSNYSQIVDVLNSSLVYRTSVNIYDTLGNLLDFSVLDGSVDNTFCCKDRIVFSLLNENSNYDVWVYDNGFDKILSNIRLIDYSTNDVVFND